MNKFNFYNQSTQALGAGVFTTNWADAFSVNAGTSRLIVKTASVNAVIKDNVTNTYLKPTDFVIRGVLQADSTTQLPLGRISVTPTNGWVFNVGFTIFSNFDLLMVNDQNFAIYWDAYVNAAPNAMTIDIKYTLEGEYET